MDCFQKFGHLTIVQRLNFFLFSTGRFTCVSGIDPEIAHLDGLLQGFVQNAVNVADGFR